MAVRCDLRSDGPVRSCSLARVHLDLDDLSYELTTTTSYIFRVHGIMIFTTQYPRVCSLPFLGVVSPAYWIIRYWKSSAGTTYASIMTSRNYPFRRQKSPYWMSYLRFNRRSRPILSQLRLARHARRSRRLAKNTSAHIQNEPSSSPTATDRQGLGYPSLGLIVPARSVRGAPVSGRPIACVPLG
jgi:hypothetical protein